MRGSRLWLRLRTRLVLWLGENFVADIRAGVLVRGFGMRVYV